MRHTFPLLALVALLSACGGSKQAATTSTAAVPDPARTLRQLVAGAPDPLRLLTPASRQRVTLSELTEGIGAFADDAPVHARQLDTDLAVAWTAGEHRAEGMTEQTAYAVPLKLVGGRWLAEIGGPVTLSPLGPDPGQSVGAIPQVAVEIKAPRPIVDSALLIDGAAIDTRSGGPSTRYVSIYGAPLNPLVPGRHVAVAVARAGKDVSARAWPFTVTG